MTDSESRPPARVLEKAGFLEHSIGAVATALQGCSLSKLAALAKPEHGRRFKECYIASWLIILIASLVQPVRSSFVMSLCIVIAAYRAIDILSYRVFFLFVKSRLKPWSVLHLRESLVYAMVNLAELSLAFASLYLYTGTLKEGSGATVSSGLDALYFSATTMLTVGFGDVLPIGHMGRLIVLLQFIFMVLYLLLLLPLLLSAFSNALQSSE